MNRYLSKHIIYPSILALRGERVFRYLEDFEKSQWLSPSEIREMQAEKLRSLLGHAYSSIPFYRALLDKSKLKPNDIRSLDDVKLLPILEKTDMRALAESIRLPQKKLGKFTVRRSAGTSGIPVVVYVDAEANAQSLAARHRAQGWHGIQSGDKQARFWGRPITSEKRFESAKDFLLNRERIVSTDLTAEGMGHVLKRLLRFKPDFFYGYPSMILRFADYLDSIDYRASELGLKAVVCTSELSMNYERQRLSRLFGCPAVDEYGCSEIDILAFECPAGNRHIPAENVLVEVLPADEAGSEVGELVITDLNNHLMPLIRYRLGDMGALSAGQCDCGRGLPILESVNGRNQGQFARTPENKLIHSMTFAYFFEQLVGEGLPIKQFRVIQEDIHTLTFQIVLESDNGQTRRQIDERLATQIAPILGGGVKCQIDYTDMITLSSEKYKFSFFESRL